MAGQADVRFAVGWHRLKPRASLCYRLLSRCRVAMTSVQHALLACPAPTHAAPVENGSVPPLVHYLILAQVAGKPVGSEGKRQARCHIKTSLTILPGARCSLEQLWGAYCLHHNER